MPTTCWYWKTVRFESSITGCLELMVPTPNRRHARGVGFFFEPEHAQAALSGWMLPLSSLAGAILRRSAGLLLLSGQYYLDFSYGKEDVLHEVAEQPPVPLLARG